MIVDGDTSDEEYIQDEEAAKADSDACSDFDNDEAEKEAEPEGADQSTNQEPDDHSDNDGDIDTDDDDDDKDDTKNMVSQSHKRTTASRRVLDSDSEDEENEMKFPKNGQSESETLHQAESTSEHLCASSTVSDNTVYSAVLFEDTKDCNEPIANLLTAQREEVKVRLLKKGGPRRRFGTTLGGALLEEASMPPLMLDSVQSDESSASSLADKSEADGEMNANSTGIGEDLGFHSEEARQPFSTQPVQEEEGEGEGEGGERDEGGGEQDNSSLELSLLWQPSMPPPAQVRKDSSEELLPPTKVSFVY